MAARIRARSSLIVVLHAFVIALAFAPIQSARATLLFEAPREVEFRLDRPRLTSSIDLLQPLRDVAHDRLGPFRLYTTGSFGRWAREPRSPLVWNPDGTIDALSPSLGGFGGGAPPSLFDEDGPLEITLPVRQPWPTRYDFRFGPTFETTGLGLETDGFAGVFRLPPVEPVVDWRCRRKPVLVLRSGGESDRFDLVRCDGSVAPEALDRLSILARPHDAERPGDLLPEEPLSDSWALHREWTPGVRIVHPRLVWALQKIADAFPRKPIVLYSGYRPLAEVNDGTGHKSQHAGGRALDISVHKISSEELFRVCTKLRGIGCGFYPNHKFVHIDVRRAGAGEAFFIDGSEPGQPANYLTDYPGLVEDGKLIKKSASTPPSPRAATGANP